MTEDGFYDDLQAALESDDLTITEAANTELRRRSEAHPGDALVQYLVASAFDGAGREEEAMPFYDRVFALGIEHLPVQRRSEVYVQAGSTLRNLGRYDAARTLLAEGMERFPDSRALAAFAALVEMSAEDVAAAATLLFQVVTMEEDASLRRFQRALRWYVAELSMPSQA